MTGERDVAFVLLVSPLAWMREPELFHPILDSVTRGIRHELRGTRVSCSCQQKHLLQ